MATDFNVLPNDNAAFDAGPEFAPGFDLENLIGQKSQILQHKLDVLADEIKERLFFRERNLERIASAEAEAAEGVYRLARKVRYQLREPRDLTPLHQQQFQLNQERRDQDTTCWRELVPVIRDYLDAWEAHEQAQSRARFITHAGPGTA